MAFFMIGLSNICNGKCPACANVWFHNHITPMNITSKNFLKILNNINVDNIERLNFTSVLGDCIFNNELLDIIEILYHKTLGNISLSFVTNGSNTKLDWKKLSESMNRFKYHEVEFALDGYTQEVYNMYRKGINFNDVINNAKIFIESGGNATWQFIVFDHNRKQSILIKNIAYDMGFRSVSFVKSWNDRCNNRSKNNEESHGGNTTCDWEKIKKYYVSTDGFLFPCCHIVTEFMAQKYNMRKDTKLYDCMSKHLFSIYEYTLNEILYMWNENNFYDDIKKVCGSICK